jgi:hypothetical protein
VRFHDSPAQLSLAKPILWAIKKKYGGNWEIVIRDLIYSMGEVCFL